MQTQEQVIWNLAKTWQYYCEPARPNPSEVGIVDHQITQNSKILLLGSTPEYREMLAKKSCDVTIVDYSEVNFLAMTSLMKAKPIAEHFIQEDWLKMHFSNKFDFVIGDHVINLISIDQWENFLRHIKGVLNEAGKFVQRVIISPDSYHKTLQDIFKETKQLVGSAIFSKTFYDLIFSVRDKEAQTASLQNVWEQVKSAYSLGLLSEEQFDYFKSLSIENNKMKAFFTEKKYLLSTLKDVFSENKLIQGDLHYKDFTFFVISQ